MRTARRWPTRITLAQFRQVTGLDTVPDHLKPCLNASGELEIYGNGEFTYELRGIVCKVSVTWNFQAPNGAGDTHYSIMRGSKVNLVIKQGAEQNFQPTLFIERGALTGDTLSRQVGKAIAALQKKYPGVGVQPTAGGFAVVIPDRYRVGHETHFAQVTKACLDYLAAGKLPKWEVPNMLVKYHTLMQAYEMSR
jgi:hypothetical protein